MTGVKGRNEKDILRVVGGTVMTLYPGPSLQREFSFNVSPDSERR